MTLFGKEHYTKLQECYSIISIDRILTSELGIIEVQMLVPKSSPQIAKVGSL